MNALEANALLTACRISLTARTAIRSHFQSLSDSEVDDLAYVLRLVQMRAIAVVLTDTPDNLKGLQQSPMPKVVPGASKAPLANEVLRAMQAQPTRAAMRAKDVAIALQPGTSEKSVHNILCRYPGTFHRSGPGWYELA